MTRRLTEVDYSEDNQHPEMAEARPRVRERQHQISRTEATDLHGSPEVLRIECDQLCFDVYEMRQVMGTRPVAPFLRARTCFVA